MMPSADVKAGSAIHWYAVGLLLIVSITWGSAFPLIKIAVADIPPITLAGSRMAIAAVLLAALASIESPRTEFSRSVSWQLARIAIFGHAVPFCLLAWGEQRISSGIAAVLLATVPIITALYVCRGISMRWSSLAQGVGVLPGFCGVILFIGPAALQGQSATIMGMLAVLGAAASYAAGLIMIGKLPPLPPIASAARLFTLAAMVLLPLSLIIEQPWTISPSTGSFVALLVLSVFCTALTMVLHFRLIASSGVAFASLNNYIAPVVGMLLGTTFLQERITYLDVVAVMCVFLSVFLMARFPLRPRENRPEPCRDDRIVSRSPAAIGSAFRADDSSPPANIQKDPAFR